MSMQISLVSYVEGLYFFVLSMYAYFLHLSQTHDWLFNALNYKTLGAEKSGKNAEGDSWWEKWKEVLYQDEWR
jgi:hypothetical protein